MKFTTSSGGQWEVDRDAQKARRLTGPACTSWVGSSGDWQAYEKFEIDDRTRRALFTWKDIAWGEGKLTETTPIVTFDD